MIPFVGRVGAVLFGFVLLAVALVLSTPLSLRSIVELTLSSLKGGLALLGRTVASIFPAHDEEDDERDVAEKPAMKPCRRHECCKCILSKNFPKVIG